MPDASLREFHRPADEAAALALLNRKAPTTAPAWIGPRVPDALYAGLEAAVDLSRLDLSYIRQDGDLIRIGALTQLQALADSELLRGFAGGILAEAARLSAGSALRQAATIGGALSEVKPGAAGGPGSPPELVLVLLALDGSLVYASPGGGHITVSLGSDNLPVGGFLLEVALAYVNPTETGVLLRLARTPRDQAIMAVVAVVDLRDGAVERLRLVVSGAGERPVRLPAVELALAGQALTPERLDSIEAQVAALVAPLADYLGSIDYRREMAGLLARRAVEAAARRST